MKLLLSNDDGFFAPGICTLAETLKSHTACQQFMIIAPDRNRSAASHSLTLQNPLRISKEGDQIYSVNGTPTDCVHLGVNKAFDFEPDMVISGINAGANMGDDVLYSGTVAAATEGRFLGKAAMAVSLCGDRYFETAAKVVELILADLSRLPLAKNTILNINVPDIPFDELKGIQITHLGRRHCSGAAVKQKDPRGLPIYWIGPAGSAEDESVGTDFYAVSEGYASITPLKIDLTHYEMKNVLLDWAEDFSLKPTHE